MSQEVAWGAMDVAFTNQLRPTDQRPTEKDRRKKEIRRSQPNPMEARRGVTRDLQIKPRRTPRSHLMPPSLRRHQRPLPKKASTKFTYAVPPVLSFTCASYFWPANRRKHARPHGDVNETHLACLNSFGPVAGTFLFKLGFHLFANDEDATQSGLV
jgi:hypothetical protein